jgi:hypothetical protein
MPNRQFLTALSVMLLMLGTGAASAQEKEPQVIPLIAVDSYATTALWTLVFVEYFIPEVDRRLAETGNYKIRWNKAFGGTIAKTRGVLDSLQYDLADIGIVTTPYHPDKVPFHNLPYATPLVTSDIGLAANGRFDRHVPGIHELRGQFTRGLPWPKDCWSWPEPAFPHRR